MFNLAHASHTPDRRAELMMGKGQRLIPILGRFDDGGDDGGGDAGDASARPLTLVGVISKADLVNLLIHQPSRFPISFLEEKEQQRRQQQGKLVGDAGNRHSTEKPAKAKAKAAQEPTQSKSKVLRAYTFLAYRRVGLPIRLRCALGGRRQQRAGSGERRARSRGVLVSGEGRKHRAQHEHTRLRRRRVRA
jgi:hypothetical protein